jgi:hypothetical protein
MTASRLAGPRLLGTGTTTFYAGGGATTITNLVLVNSSSSEVTVSLWIGSEAPESLIYQSKLKPLSTTSFLGPVSLRSEEALLGQATQDSVTITVNCDT